MASSAGSGKSIAYAKLLGNEDFVHYVTSKSITFGRTTRKQIKRPDVMLGNNKSISRLHAQICYNEETGNFELVCFSKNGAYVDGMFIGGGYDPVPLDSRSLVQVSAAKSSLEMRRVGTLANPAR